MGNGICLNSILIDIPRDCKVCDKQKNGAWGRVKRTESRNEYTCRKSDTNCFFFAFRGLHHFEYRINNHYYSLNFWIVFSHSLISLYLWDWKYSGPFCSPYIYIYYWQHVNKTDRHYLHTDDDIHCTEIYVCCCCCSCWLPLTQIKYQNASGDERKSTQTKWMK